ncbi:MULTISPECIES: glycosyltransferase family 2 protein [unclassified Acidovorax]|uniref:glycosyltransferase family 2 protein n=1 Tax=unclassified Acidovorax TaxID=2684926 RepID=UPI0006FD4112|nr:MULTISPECIES: glycosyltransferase family 2 protein [unclassified Acidovorax]KRB26993.1 glycosyl transferase [Acidovorax sp. Root70]PUA98793.1 glycosyltransferase involved in cell wall biosynthesis [Acidovorax sp. 107]
MLSLVVPVYRNEESLPDLLAAVQGLSEQLSGAMETIFVVDGSPDRSYEILRERLAQCAFRSRLVLLTRNFGSFAAIRAGLEIADGPYFAVMAADLQEPPELVLQMYGILAQDQADIVVAVREARMEPLLKRLPAQIFWGLYRRYVVPDVPPGGVDVFACNRVFRDTLMQLEERHSSLIAQIFWLGFRRRQVPYVRQPRQHGKSAWTLRKKINYLMDSVFAFTDLPIRLLVRGGAMGAAAAAIVGLIVAVARAIGAITVPGYAMTMLMIVFFGALNLLSLGIVGSYAWRAYENTKARPLAIRLRVETFNSLESRVSSHG